MSDDSTSRHENFIIKYILLADRLDETHMVFITVTHA